MPKRFDGLPEFWFDRLKMFDLIGLTESSASVVPATSLAYVDIEDRKISTPPNDLMSVTKGTMSLSVNSQTDGNNNKKKPEPNSKEKKVYTPRMFDVWAFGITTVIGGQYYGWNQALVAGFGSFCIAQIFIGFSYINLAFSLSEIISTTSFSGGAYGMARVVLGFYAGFMVAAFELMEYISYTSFSAVFISDMFCDKLNWDTSYKPLICFVFYLIAAVFVLDENNLFWRINALLGLFTVIVLLVYCFGCLGHVDMPVYGPLDINTQDKTAMGNWFHGGMIAFMQALPFATWGFGGIESAALITDMVEDPRVNLSYGLAASVATLFICMIFIMFVACSLPPGMDSFVEMPYFMNTGWEMIGVSADTAEWLLIPAQFAMAFGFILPSSKLLYAMAQSNLVPSFMGLKQHHLHQQQHHHRLATLYVLLLSFLLCFLPIYSPVSLENVPILLAQFTYLSDFYAFYRMRMDFSHRDYKFRNPFGIIGAGFSALCFILTAIAVIGWEEGHVSIIFLIVYGSILTVGYYVLAKKHQGFSDDEQKSLLSLHVLNHNKRKRGVFKKKAVGVNDQHGKNSEGHQRSLSKNQSNYSSTNNQQGTNINPHNHNEHQKEPTHDHIITPVELPLNHHYEEHNNHHQHLNLLTLPSESITCSTSNQPRIYIPASEVVDYSISKDLLLPSEMDELSSGAIAEVSTVAEVAAEVIQQSN